jgi:hypothetical protein
VRAEAIMNPAAAPLFKKFFLDIIAHPFETCGLPHASFIPETGKKLNSNGVQCTQHLSGPKALKTTSGADAARANGADAAGTKNWSPRVSGTSPAAERNTPVPAAT